MRIRGMVLCALAAMASACAQPERMTADEAENIMASMARGQRIVDVCTTEGARSFRTAVRVYARAQAAEGRDWPVFAASDDGALLDPEAAIVALGYFGGLIEVSDLRGAPQSRLRRWTWEHWPDVARVRTGAREACPEFARLQAAGARYASLMQRRSITTRDALARARGELEEAIEALQARLADKGLAPR